MALDTELWQHRTDNHPSVNGNGLDSNCLAHSRYLESRQLGENTDCIGLFLSCRKPSMTLAAKSAGI